jgi:uncharacterized protein (TIGR03118 family)
MSLSSLPFPAKLETVPSRPLARRVQNLLAATALCLSPFASAAHAQTNAYTQTNLISDGSVAANRTDANLINPWGLSIGTDFWIDAQGTGLSLVTDATGAPSFNVTIPSASGTGKGLPAGTVFNADTTIFPIQGGSSAIFLFGTLDGTIAAWNASTPQAVTVVNNADNNASYTDIVLNTNATGTFLLGANFAAGTVDVFDKNFAPAHLSGTFSDPSLPAGFAPFGIHSIGGKIYVTYAQLNPANGREVVGAGLGYVNVFDNNGNFIARAISQGNLNAPWGMALAPSGFGAFAGNLLVGNFGDGTINAYDAASFAFKGTLQNGSGTPITNSGLWEIVFGTSNSGGVGDPNTLYFTAGINGEKGGLVGTITSGQPSTATGDFTFASSASGSSSLAVTSQTPGTLSLALTGSNGFSGAVSFSCSNLPSNAVCSFSPATVQLSGSTPASVAVTVTESAAAAPAPPPPSGYIQHSSLRTSHLPYALAFLAPFGLLGLGGLRRRRLGQCLIWVMALAIGGFGIVGCSKSTSTPAAVTPTPVNQSVPTQITINATSGTITHSTTVSLTLN